MSASLLADGTLSIIGTNHADKIRVRPAKADGYLKVGINRHASFFSTNDVKAIVINARGGDDDASILNVGGSISVPVSINGGAGDDTLGGGAGNDILVGDAGNDFLYGGKGDDKLEGDGGADQLTGTEGQDSLLGGDGNDTITTTTDDQVDAGTGDNSVRSGWISSFPIETFTGTPSGYSVIQQRQAYGLGDLKDGDYTNRGKGQAIAIVNPFHASTAFRDLITFSHQMGISAPTKSNFKYVFASGKRPLFDEQFSAEAELDSQWAHAIAPDAVIYMVEARSTNPGDLFQAIQKAVSLLNKTHHGGVVSLSGSIADVNEDGVFEPIFSSDSAKNISFIAGSGDNGGVVTYPSSSPNVTSVGGTTLYVDEFGNRVPSSVFTVIDPVTGLEDWTSGTSTTGGDIDCPGFLVSGGERPWWSPLNSRGGAGGGPSAVFPTPVYQQNRGISPNGRGTPDVSWNADPITGVSVYNSAGEQGQSGWATVGGTSAGTAQFAAVIALANQVRASQHKGAIGSSLLGTIYRLGGRGADQYFNDIRVHGVGPIGTSQCPDNRFTTTPGWRFPATSINGQQAPGTAAGWDFASGWGSPSTHALIPALAGQKINLINRSLDFTGTLSQQLFGGTGLTSGAQLITTGFKGNTSVQGLTTLAVGSVGMRQTFTTDISNQVGTKNALIIMGMDPQTGIPNPGAFNANSGQLISGSGTPIIFSRNGNEVTGIGFYVLFTVSGTAPNLTFTLATDSVGNAINGTLRFQGTVSKDGSISGEFFAIDVNGARIKNVVNDQSQGVVAGTFKD